MVGARIDPEEVEKFAKELRRFNTELRNSRTRIQGRFNLLGETWRDRKHERFTQEFNQIMRIIEQFLKISEEHVGFLIKDAKFIRTYLEH